MPKGIDNTEALGRILYTQYAYLFEAAGLVLLVAMIGAIVLTLRHKEGVRRQSIARPGRARAEDRDGGRQGAERRRDRARENSKREPDPQGGRPGRRGAAMKNGRGDHHDDDPKIASFEAARKKAAAAKAAAARKGAGPGAGAARGLRDWMFGGAMIAMAIGVLVYWGWRLLGAASVAP